MFLSLLPYQPTIIVECWWCSQTDERRGAALLSIVGLDSLAGGGEARSLLD
jgi:hypothetical protein